MYFGRYGKDGKVTHVVDNGKLVPADTNKYYGGPEDLDAPINSDPYGAGRDLPDQSYPTEKTPENLRRIRDAIVEKTDDIGEKEYEIKQKLKELYRQRSALRDELDAIETELETIEEQQEDLALHRSRLEDHQSEIEDVLYKMKNSK
jgi:hypothetical protein